MVSNFLGDVGEVRVPSSIISANELVTREGVELKNGMNFRDTGEHIRPAGFSTSSLYARSRLSVFLVLPREGGFTDEWREESQTYVYEGHDSTTVESGKARDQLAMYESGKLTENGKFLKAANAFADGVRKEPLQVQVYEKLTAGVWYDKGIFNLIAAKHEQVEGRKVYKFYLTLADAEFYSADDPDKAERMLPATTKVEIWERCRGRCAECGTQSGLHMIAVSGKGMELRCASHGGTRSTGLLG
jgi:hypothetical protein